MVDDESFPYQSTAVPMLSKSGAFAPEAVYTSEDVAEVVAQARSRGIRVIPEIDTPGHTLSWGHGDKRLLTTCHDSDGMVTGQMGPLNPIEQHTYTTVWKLFRELEARFPDAYIHLGGDEVALDCWKNNPEIQAWMMINNMTDVKQLQQHYTNIALSLARRAGRSTIVWEEVLKSDAALAKDAIVQVWKWWSPHSNGHAAAMMMPIGTAASGNGSSRSRSSGNSSISRNDSSSSSSTGATEAHDLPCRLSTGCRGEATSDSFDGSIGTAPYAHRLHDVTKQGFRALLSSPWYLNLAKQGEASWAAYHAVEPLAFKGSKAQHKLVIGGEAAMWGEYCDASNALSKTWPNAAAVAERLWSPPTKGRAAQEPDAVQRRLEEHRCRMLARGSTAAPIGPGYCPADPLHTSRVHKSYMHTSYIHNFASTKGSAGVVNVDEDVVDIETSPALDLV